MNRQIKKSRWRRQLLKALNWVGRLFGRPRTIPPRAEPPESSRTKLERSLGFAFTRAELLETALTHPSAAVGSDVHYERLEFLGDAVLELAIADLLMRKFPTAKEGPLSKQRASIVNARTLALKARSEERRVGKECRSRWAPYP